jgi:hypothetical protein
MKLLTFCPWLYLNPGTVLSILRQKPERQNDLMLSYDNPYGDPNVGDYRNCQTQYEKMRQLVVRDYDKVWIVEHDMIVPVDALEKLLSVDADVVSGYYLLRHGADHSNLFSMQGKPLKENHNLVAMGGGAMGCLLVDKKVFEGFSFMMPNQSAPDGEFMRHCREKKFRQVARLDVICGHIKPSGEVIWPPSQSIH